MPVIITPPPNGQSVPRKDPAPLSPGESPGGKAPSQLQLPFSAPGRAPGPKAEGCRFLCQMFALLVSSPQRRNYLLACAQAGLPISKDEAIALTQWWKEAVLDARVPLTKDSPEILIHIANQGIWKDVTLDFCLSSITSSNTFDELCDRRLITMLSKQTGCDREFLLFLAVTTAFLAADRRTEEEVSPLARDLLMLSLRELGLPAGWTYIRPDLRAQTGELRRLLVLSLSCALYAVYPQRIINLASNHGAAREIFLGGLRIIQAEFPDGLADAVWMQNQLLLALNESWCELAQALMDHRIPGFSGTLDQLFEMPVFSPCFTSHGGDLLRCDQNAALRVFVYGEQAGKSTLLRMVQLCCMLAHPFFTGLLPTCPRLCSIASSLKLRDDGYFPLPLSCAGGLESDGDPLVLAAEQLVRSLHLADTRLVEAVRDLCRQQCREGRVLLLVDDWDQAGRSMQDKLLHLDRSIHILATSSQPSRSQLRILNAAFQCWYITAFSPEGRRALIARLADQALPHRREEIRAWVTRLPANRYLSLFSDTHARLLRVLEEPEGQWSEMLVRCVKLELDRLDDADGRTDGFFQCLALCVLERRWQDTARGASDADLQRNPDVILCNLMDLPFYRSHFPEQVDPERIWAQASSRQVLVCPADVPQGYRFKNRLFCYSLAADGYLELLLGRREDGEDLLARFNRLSPEAFSYVIPLLMDRLCGARPEESGYRSEELLQAVCRLCQCVAAYALAQEESWQIRHCCQTIADLLQGTFHPNLLCLSQLRWEDPNQRLLWRARQLLLRAYLYLYGPAARSSEERGLPTPIQLLGNPMERLIFQEECPHAFLYPEF